MASFTPSKKEAGNFNGNTKYVDYNPELGVNGDGLQAETINNLIEYALYLDNQSVENSSTIQYINTCVEEIQNDVGEIKTGIADIKTKDAEQDSALTNLRTNFSNYLEVTRYVPYPSNVQDTARKNINAAKYFVVRDNSEGKGIASATFTEGDEYDTLTFDTVGTGFFPKSGGYLDANGKILSEGITSSPFEGCGDAILQITKGPVGGDEFTAQRYAPLFDVKTYSGHWTCTGYNMNKLFFNYIRDIDIADHIDLITASMWFSPDKTGAIAVENDITWEKLGGAKPNLDWLKTTIDGVATATGENSIAIGNSSSDGRSAIGLGYKSTATGENSIAIGNTCNSEAKYGVAICAGASVTGEATAGIAIGFHANVNLPSGGKAQVAIGHSASVNGGGGVSLGNNTTCDGYVGVSVGDTASCNEAAGVAIGNKASCNEAGGVAIGNSVTATSEEDGTQIAIGTASHDRVRIGKYILKDCTLPDVTNANNGKVLGVTNGKWGLVDQSSLPLPIEKTKIYGVDGIGSANPTLTRTDSAENISVSIGESEIQSGFDGCYPWSEMKEVTDKDGNVFIKIPKFYAKYTANEDGTQKLQISGTKYDGFDTLFVDGKGNEIDYVLVGKYEASGSKSKALSKSGQTCLVNITLPDMRTACQANGEGYQQYDFLIDAIIKELFLIEFATTNSQAIMKGYTDSSNSAALITGHTDAVKTPSGSWNTSHTDGGSTCNTDGKHACKYRGIENLWGNLFKWCDGITFSKEKVYVCLDPTHYVSEDTSFPYILMGKSQVDGYVSKIEYFEKFPVLGYVTEADGDESSYYCDYAYCGGTVLAVGGRWCSDVYAGLWCWYGDRDTSYSGSHFGGRLCYKPISSHTLPSYTSEDNGKILTVQDAVPVWEKPTYPVSSVNGHTGNVRIGFTVYEHNIKITGSDEGAELTFSFVSTVEDEVFSNDELLNALIPDSITHSEYVFPCSGSWFDGDDTYGLGDTACITVTSMKVGLDGTVSVSGYMLDMMNNNRHIITDYAVEEVTFSDTVRSLNL